MLSTPVTESFRQHLEINGLAPSEIMADGGLHRCPTADKPHKLDGAYIFHDDDPASGWWKNWRTGQSENWTAKESKRLSPAEREDLKARIEADKTKRKEDEAIRHTEARAKAKAIWDEGEPCSADHPYLVRKGMSALGGVRCTQDGKIVLSVLDEAGQIQSLQFIGVDGGKKFLTGGKVRGGYFPIKGKPGKDGQLYLAEGYATAATIHQATGETVLAAFDCGNLLAVAEMARRLYPEREIIICADDDHKTDGNPGLSKATEAARAIKAKLVAPHFLDHAGRTDFNDMHAEQGLDAVREYLAQAKEPAPSKKQQSSVPKDFSLREDGVHFVETDNEGNVEFRFVCSFLRVVAMLRDSNGKAWGRLLELKDPDGIKKQWAMPMNMLAGDGQAYRGELLSMGLRLASGTKAKNRLHDYLISSLPEERARCVSRIGWHGRNFILPDTAYGPQDGESVILQGGPVDHSFRVAGSLEDWQESIGRYCVGNSRLVLAVSAALAAPLLHLAHAESGGFHLVGGSSCGKTTALRVAGSVCGGGGLNGFIKQWRATDNALESVSSGHCDSLLCLDELGQADAKTAGAVAYMLTNGQGKARSKRDGTARNPQEWRVLFLSTGEISLSDKVCEDGKSRTMAGQAVRVVDIPADAGAGFGLFENLHGFDNAHAFAVHLNEASKQCYGLPLRAYLDKLTAQLDDAIQAAPAFVREFVDEFCPADADGQVRRVAGRFGLVAAGGEFGANMKVLPWPQGEARQAAAKCFNDWLELRGGTGAAEVTAGLAQVRQFFQAHGSSRFEVWGADESMRIVNRAGFRKKNALDEWEYYVHPGIFRDEIARGHNSRSLVKQFVAAGRIVPGKDGYPTSQFNIPGQKGNARYYHFVAGIAGDEE